MKFKIATILLLVAALVVLFFSLDLSKNDDLIRIQLLPRTEEFRKKSPSQNFSLKRQGSTIMVGTKEGKITFQGTAVPHFKAAQETRSLVIAPRLKGKYIAEFSLLLEPGSNRELRAYVRQLRSDEIKRVRLRSTDRVQQLQIPFELQKDDTLEFFLNNAEFGFISDPIFYRDREDNSKNYVFIIAADTLRKDRVRTYNPSSDCSENIDRFTQDAVIFEQAYSTSSWTTPAFMSLFTGLFPNQHDVNYGNALLPREISTLFKAIQQKCVTYCLNGDHLLSADFGFHRGFDVYEENYGDAVTNSASHILFGKARDLVEKKQGGSALFFLHTYQVHNPYNPEIELAQQFFPEDFKQYRFDSLRFIKHGRELYKVVPQEERQNIEKVYDAACYTFDVRFGEFIRFLKERGLYRDSMIFFLSDHGEEFLDHGAWEHGHSLYNELIQIPLIVKFPQNRDAGTRVSAAVSIVDVLPTVLDVLRVKQDNHSFLDGISLLDTMKKRSKSDRVLTAYLAPRALRNGIPARISLIRGNYKYIFNQKMTEDDRSLFITPPPNFSDELYDLSEDPHERENIIESQPQTAVDFMKLIRGLKFKQGQKGFLQQLSERLKSLGYF